MQIMTLATQKKKCDLCGLFLSFSDFHKNKSKKDGLQNRCKDCIFDYKQKLKTGIIQPLQEKCPDFYIIPDIYIVGVGRTQTFQHCCLSCEAAFFCMKSIKDYTDLFCDGCEPSEAKLSERNTSNVNFVGNAVGWKVICENAVKIRNHRNYKKCFQRDAFTCQYCGYNHKLATSFSPLHIDHIKPWSAQGGNALNNLVVACQDCNLLVSNKWFKSFEEKKEYILFERQKRKLLKHKHAKEISQ